MSQTLHLTENMTICVAILNPDFIFVLLEMELCIFIVFLTPDKDKSIHILLINIIQIYCYSNFSIILVLQTSFVLNFSQYARISEKTSV